MYRIEKVNWGYRLMFGGSCPVEEIGEWLDESRKILANQEEEFFVFVDMRTIIPLSREAQVHMQEGQRLYQRRGMLRSVVILSSPVVAAQFRRIAGETGIGQWERYIDASTVPDWEEVGMDWLLKAVDPEEHVHTSKISQAR
ncbi:MAG: hypothetical protein NTW07_05955 [candidate division Zixibacteria bacterium]|nr:hypothetical protein [candidate division Zixibacteria bacterium]